jgi:hypothetical protein
MLKINYAINKLPSSRNFLRAAIAAAVTTFSILASAALPYDEPIPVAKITLVEPTPLPAQFFFIIDQPVANCAAGEFLIWNGGVVYPQGNTDVDNNDRKANIKAVSNVALAALYTGGRVRVYAKNKSAAVPNCVVQYIHALPAQ